MSSLTVESFRLKNFRSFKDEIYLNFSDGINIIVGENGSGKSNLQLGMAWTLLGIKALRKMKTAQIRSDHTSSGPFGELVLKSDTSDDKVTLTRSLSGAKLMEGDREIANTASGVETELMTRYGTSPATLMATLCVGQNELTKLASSDKETRLKTIEMIQGLDLLSKAKGLVKKKVDGLTEKLDYTIGEEHASASTEIEVLSKQLTAESRALEASKGLYEECQKEHKLLEPQFNELSKKRDELAWIESRIPALKSVISMKRSRLAESKQNIVSFEAQEQEITSSIQTLNSRLVGFDEETLQKYEVEIQNLKQEGYKAVSTIDLATSVKRDYEFKIKPEATPKGGNPTAEERSEALRERDSSRNKFILKRADVSELKAHLLAFDSDGSSCSRCGTLLEEKHKGRIQEELTAARKELKELEESKNAYEDMYSRFMSLFDIWCEYEKTHSSNSEHSITIAEKQAQIDQAVKSRDAAADSVRKIQSRYTALKELKETNQLITNKLEVKLNTLASVEQQLKQNKTVLSGLEVTIAETEAQLMIVSEQKLAMFNVPQQYSEISEVMTAITQELRINEAATADSVARIDNLSGGLMHARAREKTLKLAYQEQQEMKNSIDMFKRVRKSIEDFRRIYQMESVPFCELYMNQIYSQLGGNEFIDLKIDNNFEIKATHDKGQRDFADLSGAQKDSAAFALRMALGKLKTTGASNQLRFIILDEPTASFSKKREEKFCELLPRLSGLVPQVIVITHSSEFISCADRLINVTIDEKGESHAT